MEELIHQVKDVQASYHRLLLIVGSAGAGKSKLIDQAALQCGWPLVNLSLELARGLHQFRDRDRPRKVGQVAKEILEHAGGDVICLDNIELIFDPTLQQDPLRFFEVLSRTRTIVASWPGSHKNGKLAYAEPGHPEYRSYFQVGVPVLAL